MIDFSENYALQVDFMIQWTEPLLKILQHLPEKLNNSSDGPGEVGNKNWFSPICLTDITLYSTDPSAYLISKTLYLVPHKHYQVDQGKEAITPSGTTIFLVSELQGYLVL